MAVALQHLAFCTLLLLGPEVAALSQVSLRPEAAAATSMSKIANTIRLGGCFEPGLECPVPEDVANAMRENPSDRLLQVHSCAILATRIDSSNKKEQDKAASFGVLEAAIGAVKRFPDDKDMLAICAHAIGKVAIFNRENGLRAGRLGGLNLTMAGYRKWMEDPKITGLGGDVGCYLDYCDENRAILRELGGVHLLIQNIKNNFHGQYSDWAYEPVKNSLFGLSSGCWMNQDICFDEGFVGLAVKLMNEHTTESKIAEETLQVVNALIKHSDEYRQALADAGLADALVKVLRKNPSDRGAVSLVCHTISTLVGPAGMSDPTGKNPVTKPFMPKLQSLVAKAGAVEAMTSTIMSHTAMQHHDHGGFNFNIDEAYNAQADCLEGLHILARDNPSNQKAMLAAGLATDISAKLELGTFPGRAKRAACNLAKLLKASGGTFLAMWKVPEACRS